MDPDFGQDSPYHTFNWSGLVDMDASDTVYVQIRQGGGSAQTDLESSGDSATIMTGFSGHLVC